LAKHCNSWPSHGQKEQQPLFDKPRLGMQRIKKWTRNVFKKMYLSGEPSEVSVLPTRMKT
jgi:hypothetical protein